MHTDIHATNGDSNLKIVAFEWANTVHVLGRAATVISFHILFPITKALHLVNDEYFSTYGN
jgi:hypothetical protein